MVERLVVYRASTVSGTMAAWAVRMAYPGHETVFKSHCASDEAPPSLRELPRGCEVIFLETCAPSADWLVACCKRFRWVYVWDHHTASAAIATSFASLNSTNVVVNSNTGQLLNMKPLNLSLRIERYMTGCMIACRELNVQLSPKQRALFALVQDYELGIHLHPRSRQFGLAMRSRSIEGRIELNPYLFSQLAALDPDQLLSEDHHPKEDGPSDWEDHPGKETE